MIVSRVLSAQRHRQARNIGRLLQARIALGSGQSPWQGIARLGFVPLSRNVSSSLQAFQSSGEFSGPDDPESSVAKKKSILGLDFLSKLFHRNQGAPATATVEELSQVESDPAYSEEQIYAAEESELQPQEERLEEVENGVEESGIIEESTGVYTLEQVENAAMEELAVEGESVVEASSETGSAEGVVATEGVIEVEATEGSVAEATEVASPTSEAIVESSVEETTTMTTKGKATEDISSSVRDFIKDLPPLGDVAVPVVAATPPPAPTPTPPPAPAPAAASPAATSAATPEEKTKAPASKKAAKAESSSEQAATKAEEKPSEKPVKPATSEKPKAAAAAPSPATSKAVPSKTAAKKTSAPPGKAAAAPGDEVFEFLRSKMRNTAAEQTSPDTPKPAAPVKPLPRFDATSEEKTNAAINMLLESVERSTSRSPAAPIFEALNAKPEEPAVETTPTPPPSLRLSLSSAPAEPAPMDAKTLMVEMNTRITDGNVVEAATLFEEWRRTINPLTLECNKPDRTLYNLYMQAKIKDKAGYEELLEVVTEMEESGLPRDLAGYNILLRALFRQKDSGIAETLLERMEKEEPHAQPDSDSYNLVVVLCALDRKVLAATKYMRTMLDKGFEPSRTTVNEVLLATSRTHQTKLAASLLKDLKANKLPMPMWNTCAELLMSASEVDDAECARLALAAITERPMAKFGPKMVLDEGTMICVLGTAARTNDAALCSHAWDALSTHTRGLGTTPSAEAYLARIHALALNGDVATAFRALWEFELNHGRKQDSDSEAFSPFTSLKSLASACSRGGAAALDAAYYKLEEAHTKKQGVALAAINCVILGCANLWDSERAFQTFEAVENVFGLRPDIHSCNALLHALGRTKMTEDALKVYDYIKEAGFKPDKWTYMLLTDAHVVNHDANSALDVLETMVQDHHRPFRQTTLKVWTRCKQHEDNDALERLQKLEEALNYRQSFFANARRKLLLDVIKGDRPMGLDSR